MSLPEAADAVITKVAGIPWATWSSSDWMVRTGVMRGPSPVWASVRVAPPTPVPVVAPIVWGVGGPMMRPADMSSPRV